MQLNHTINSLSSAEKPIQNLVFKSYGCPKLDGEDFRKW